MYQLIKVKNHVKVNSLVPNQTFVLKNIINSRMVKRHRYYLSIRNVNLFFIKKFYGFNKNFYLFNYYNSVCVALHIFSIPKY